MEKASFFLVISSFFRCASRTVGGFAARPGAMIGDLEMGPGPRRALVRGYGG